MKYSKTLAGCIDIWEDSCEYPENTIKFVEEICNDPARDKVNWSPALYMGDDENQRKCDYLNLSAIYKNSPNPNTRGVKKWQNNLTVLLSHITAQLLYTEQVLLVETFTAD